MKASGRGVEPFVVGRSSNLGSDGPQFAGRKGRPACGNPLNRFHRPLSYEGFCHHA